MLDYKVNEHEESFVIRFGTEHRRINAYTLATTLVALADAAKAANSALNPGFEIEIVVESLGAGSFIAKIRAIYRASGNLFSSATVQAVVLGVIGNFIYQHTLAPDLEVRINVGQDEVVIEAGEKIVVVPRIVYESCRKVERSTAFSENVGKAFRVIEADQDIKFVQIRRATAHEDQNDEAPMSIPRKLFALISMTAPTEEEPSRDLKETTELQIIRAILERGMRKWEFAWKGVRISAPVTDEGFFKLFADRKITVAPGDGLEVTLKISQKLNEATGIYINTAYEVIKVLRHIPRYTQTTLV